MKINGYQLRGALKSRQLELATVLSQFNESLYKFEGETKRSPDEIAAEITRLEKEVAAIQTIQARYNMLVGVKVPDKDGEKSMLLMEAVKIVGGAGRMSKLWRNAASGKKTDRYDFDNAKTRDKDREYATQQLTKDQRLAHAKDAEKYANALRNAIGVGNSEIIDLENIDASLLRG